MNDLHRIGYSGARWSRHDSGMGNRIFQLRKAKGLTLEALAERLGTSQQQVHRLEKGERKLTADWLSRLASALEVPMMAILVDEDAITPPASRSEGQKRLDMAGLESALVPATGPDDGVEYRGNAYVPLPVFDVNVSCGPGAMNAEAPEPEGYQLFGLDWVRGVTRAPVSSLAIVRVSGDSMANTLQHGDLILVDQSVRTMGRDGLYVLAAGQDIMVKRIARDWADRTLTVASDNPAYPPSRGVREEDIFILGRVVWLGRNLGG